MNTPCVTCEGFDVWLEMGTACNLACDFCYNRFQQASSRARAPLGSLPVRVSRILQELSRFGTVRRVTLAGGEVFLYRTWQEIVQIVSDTALECAIVTNGSVCPPGYAKYLQDVGIGLVQFSLHGADHATHDGVVGVAGAFDALLRAAMEAREQDVPIGISYVWRGQPVADAVGVVEWASVLGAMFLMVNSVRHPVGPLERDAAPRGREDYHRVVSAVRHASGELVVPVVVTGFLPNNMRAHDVTQVRGAPEEVVPRLNVDSNGNLRSCLAAPFSLGNLFSEDAEVLVRSLVNGTRVPTPEECHCVREEAEWASGAHL